jgi:RNA polymerase sigma-70 factor, ECF subfamily
MAVTAIHLQQEDGLLEAARGGDERAFRHIVENHRAELHAHCYRMLGSLDDADDALQDTLMRAWRGLSGFGRQSSVRTWLYAIATNVCRDAIARRPKRVLPIGYGPVTAPGDALGEPLVESVWIEPYPDERLGPDDRHAAPEARYEQREALELAFVAALQHLPGTQRAVLILREVLGFTAREVAESLETTVPSVNSALQRARKTVAERLPARSQQATLRSVGDRRIRELVTAYVDAWARGDVEAVRALLAEDAVFSMPPWASWWRGRDTIAGFVEEAAAVCAISLAVPVSANGQPALAYYKLNADTGTYQASALDVLTFDGTAITEITAFVTPEAFACFGLSDELACAVPTTTSAARGASN